MQSIHLSGTAYFTLEQGSNYEFEGSMPLLPFKEDSHKSFSLVLAYQYQLTSGTPFPYIFQIEGSSGGLVARMKATSFMDIELTV